MESVIEMTYDHVAEEKTVTEPTEKRNDAGKLHCVDGWARQLYGQTEYWIDGKRHCLSGPAVIFSNGGKQWWVNGKLHSYKHAACQYPSGNKEYWIHGRHFESEAEWKSYKKLHKRILRKLIAPISKYIKQ